MVQLTLRKKPLESLTNSHQKITFVKRNQVEDLTLKLRYFNVFVPAGICS